LLEEKAETVTQEIPEREVKVNDLVEDDARENYLEE
jgi:hypothetical protein